MQAIALLLVCEFSMSAFRSVQLMSGCLGLSAGLAGGSLAAPLLSELILSPRSGKSWCCGLAGGCTLSPSLSPAESPHLTRHGDSHEPPAPSRSPSLGYTLLLALTFTALPTVTGAGPFSAPPPLPIRLQAGTLIHQDLIKGTPDRPRKTLLSTVPAGSRWQATTAFSAPTSTRNLARHMVLPALLEAMKAGRWRCWAGPDLFERLAARSDNHLFRRVFQSELVSLV